MTPQQQQQQQQYDLTHMTTEDLLHSVENLAHDKEVMGLGEIDECAGEQIKMINRALDEINRTLKTRRILAQMGYYADTIEVLE